MCAQTSVEGIDAELENPADGNPTWEFEKTAAPNDPEQTLQQQTKKVDVPPDGGYGWVGHF